MRAISLTSPIARRTRTDAMTTRGQTLAAEAETEMRGREVTVEATETAVVEAIGIHPMAKEAALVVATAETVVAAVEDVAAADSRSIEVWTMSTMATAGLTIIRMLSTNMCLLVIGPSLWAPPI